METIINILIFASGVTLGGFVVFKFQKPTTVNEYSGSNRFKVKGRNNTQNNDNRAEINGGMKRTEVIQIWKSLRK